MANVKVALIYDFDKTLSPKDMQEFHYLKSIGYENPSDFWKKCQENSDRYNMDGILSYMEMMAKSDPNLTQTTLRNEGKFVELYNGVDTWFERINEYGKKHNVDVEHYIISSGLTDIIMGTSIAKEFKKIYACTYAYDENGRVLWPSRIVNYTMKTQYLFRINKGVFDETNDNDLNASNPEKYVQIQNMVYFGDGMTDVPSMKVVNQFGGYTIAVFGDLEKKKDLAMELYNHKRADYALQADYSKDSKIEKVVQSIIDKIEIETKLEEYK